MHSHRPNELTPLSHGRGSASANEAIPMHSHLKQPPLRLR